MTANDVIRDLPDPVTLQNRCRALAMLDAIVCPNRMNRYFAFGGAWIPARLGTSASMRNGSGDEYDIVFDTAGVFIRGLAPESPMAQPSPDGDSELWPGLIETVPRAFAAYVDDSVFGYEDELQATVVIWRQTDDGHWSCGDIEFPEGHKDPDGSASLFAVVLDGHGSAYQRHAEDQHGIPVDLGAVQDLFGLTPLTADLVDRLNPGLALADLTEDATQIGYPLAERR